MQIVDLEVEQGEARLQLKEDRNRLLDDAAQEFVIEKGYDPTYGARPMRRAVERYLEDPLAEELLRGNVKAGDLVQVTVENGKLVFKVAEPQTARRRARAELPSSGLRASRALRQLRP